MFRNAYQMHKDVRLLIDEHATTRFNDSEIDRFLNMAVERILRDRVDNIKIPKKYGFESHSRNRNDINSLLKFYEGELDDFYVDFGERTLGNPLYKKFEKSTGDVRDFGFDITNIYDIYRVEVKHHNKYHEAKYLTQDEIYNIESDPFLFKDNYTFYYSYGSQDATLKRGFTLYVYSNGVLQDNTIFRLHYIMNPKKIKFYNSILSTPTVINANFDYHVITNLVTPGGNKEADTTIISSVDTALGSQVITSGTVYRVDNCDLSGSIHDEVVEKASSLILRTAENFQKKQYNDIDNEKV